MCIFYAYVYNKIGDYILIDIYIHISIYPTLDNKIASILVMLAHIGGFQSKSIKNLLIVGQLGFIAD